MDISRRTLLAGAGTGALALAVSPVLAHPAEAGLMKVGSIWIPKIKLRKNIYSGTENKVINRGVFGHWKGSALPGTNGNTILFAHRTSHGGPMRRANLLKPGDLIVTGGVTYTVRDWLVVPKTLVTKSWFVPGSGPRLTLIACSKPNGQPTSLKYRIIVRAAA